METYKIQLGSAGLQRRRVDGVVLKNLLDILIVGTRQALRLRVDGRSSFCGQIPEWLTMAAGFDFVLDPPEGLIAIEMKSLVQSAPEKFSQMSLFRTGLDVQKPAFALWEESIKDVFSGNMESENYDDGLIKTIGRFGHILSDEMRELRIFNGRLNPISIERAKLQSIKKLTKSTPPTTQVRVSGKLDMIRYSDRMFDLKLESGETVRGVATKLDPGALAKLFGQETVVTGRAVFHPSGKLRRVEAHKVEPAEGAVSLWSKAPKPLMAPIVHHDLRKPQSPRTGLNAIIGKWPGDESDDEFMDALENL